MSSAKKLMCRLVSAKLVWKDIWSIALGPVIRPASLARVLKTTIRTSPCASVPQVLAHLSSGL
jgi:hypothetical protein